MSSLEAKPQCDYDFTVAGPQHEPIKQFLSAAPKRDIRIDSLRGLMLVEMMLVHTRCPAAVAAYEMFGRVSPAAGFVFLSGLVAGAVYSRYAKESAAVVFQRCARRAMYIHGYHLVTFFALLAVVLIAPRANAYFQFELGDSAGSVARTVGWFAIWAYQPNLFDILPLYGLFVLCMPVALLALARNRGAQLLSVSLLVWLLAQIGLGRLVNGGGHFGFFQGDFNPFAWQFVFFSGLYVGHVQLYRLRRIVAPHPVLVALCLLVCLIGLTMRWQLLPWPAPFAAEGWLASKRDYGAAYLINFLAFAYLVYCAGVRFPRLLEWPALAFLGRHSIQVFSFHIVVIYLAGSLLWRVAIFGPWASDAFGVALATSLYAAAWSHSKWRRLRGLSRSPIEAIHAKDGVP